jgi:hypothetical protein
MVRERDLDAMTESGVSKQDVSNSNVNAPLAFRLGAIFLPLGAT